jgi:hypothetical protein
MMLPSNPPTDPTRPWAAEARPSSASLGPGVVDTRHHSGIAPPEVQLAAEQPGIAAPRYIKVERQHGRYPDLWASILFLLFTAMFIAFCALGLPELWRGWVGGGIEPSGIVVAIGVAVGLAIALAYLAFMLHSPKAMVITSFVLGFLFNCRAG